MSSTPEELEIIEAASKQKLADFHYFVPLQKSFLDETLKDNADEQAWKVGGYASSAGTDLDGESLNPEGLDIDYFLRFGWFNDDHQKGAAHKIGIPTTGRIDRRGFYVEGILIKEMPAAQGIYRLMKAIATGNYNRNIGFSVEGKVLQQEGDKIVRAWVKDVAITANPINTNTFANLIKSLSACKISKGLEAGNAVAPQEGGGVLRTQDLEKDLKYMIWGHQLPYRELIKYTMLKANVDEDSAVKIVRLAAGKKLKEM